MAMPFAQADQIESAGNVESLIMGETQVGGYSFLPQKRNCPMENLLFRGLSHKETFEAQVIAALMIQSNTLIPIKLAVRLCGISRQEINRCIARGTFLKSRKLSRRGNATRKAFYLKDIHEWIKNLHIYAKKTDP